MIKATLFLFYLFCSLQSIASVSVLHTHKKIKTMSFKEACDAKFTGNSLLIDRINSSELDCTGKKLNIYEVCSGSKLHGAPFARAIIAEDGDMIFCEYASTVKVTLPCKSSIINGRCEDEGKECETIRKIYAYDLVGVHSGVVYEYSKKKSISCYFKLKT